MICRFLRTTLTNHKRKKKPLTPFVEITIGEIMNAMLKANENLKLLGNFPFSRLERNEYVFLMDGPLKVITWNYKQVSTYIIKRVTKIKDILTTKRYSLNKYT